MRKSKKLWATGVNSLGSRSPTLPFLLSGRFPFLNLAQDVPVRAPIAVPHRVGAVDAGPVAAALGLYNRLAAIESSFRAGRGRCPDPVRPGSGRRKLR